LGQPNRFAALRQAMPLAGHDHSLLDVSTRPCPFIQATPYGATGVHHFCAIAEMLIDIPARLDGRMAPGWVLDGRAENGRAGPGVPREPARLGAAPIVTPE
jgi:hypothetical protein